MKLKQQEKQEMNNFTQQKGVKLLPVFLTPIIMAEMEVIQVLW